MTRVILINGAFGVGKTTVARALRAEISNSVVYDPEWAGIALQRAPRWLSVDGSGTGDFQDMPRWRRSVISGTRFAARFAETVIVPMGFDNPAYFAEIWAGLCRLSPDARAFCLIASEPTIRARIRRRGDDPDDPWFAKRVAECVTAHAADTFGTRIDTEGRTVHEVVAEILAGC